MKKPIQKCKLAEDELNQVRANMQAIIENTLDNIWAINTHYEILYTNDVFARSFQAVFGVLLTPGVNLLNALPPALRQTWKERYDRAFNGERFVFVDTIDMENTLIHIEVAVHPIVHEGKVLGASFFGRDVTARRQGEQALEVALVKYKTLFEAFPLGISVTDEAGKILETNAFAEKLLALPQSEHTRRDIDSPIWHIIREDGTPMPSEEYASVRALKEKRLVENVCMGIVKPDETIIWLNVTAAPLPVPGYGVVVTYSDITAQKQMEERYRSLFTRTLDGVYRSSHAGKFIDINPAMVKMFGYSSLEEMLKVDIKTELYFDPAERGSHILDTGEVGHETYRMRRKDGSEIWVEDHGSYIHDEQGNILFHEGILRDVTERKQTEQRIRQLNSDLERRVQARTAQLEAANQELEAFSYSVSHDLRAPLRAIDGFSRILSEEYAGLLPDEGRVLLERICSGATQMGALIDDLLQFSRLGRQALRTQLVDMNTLVQVALGTLQSEIEKLSPHITIQALPAGQCDPSLLIQVWVNLLSNAIKYSHKRAAPQIEIGCACEGPTKVYYIKDNGVGFDMRYADKLFGVFQRLHNESEFKGTGVGLALVHRIITRHGGQIWAESESGKGATFYFTLG